MKPTEKLNPRLFVSYAREDQTAAEQLSSCLAERGFRVFLDTEDIDPGDNFVSTLTHAVRKSDAIVPVVSSAYGQSRWGQAELYQALTSNKSAIPFLLSRDALTKLDDPLQRLLRDTQYVEADGDIAAATDKLVARLAGVRKRYRFSQLKLALAGCGVIAVLSYGLFWIVENLNSVQAERNRVTFFDKLFESENVLQSEKVVQLASIIEGDASVTAELALAAANPALSDVDRMNALLASSKLKKGEAEYRWYIEELDLENVSLASTSLNKVSFLKGNWHNISFTDTVFAKSIWTEDMRWSSARFNRSDFLGTEMTAVVAVDAEFIDSKFVGSVIDTTHFSKVRFRTSIDEAVEGNPVITPNFTLFERSTLISNREPPMDGVMDLTEVGDDVTFDEVLFVNTELKGWFDASWFRNSTFTNCVLPDGLTREALEEAGNIVEFGDFQG